MLVAEGIYGGWDIDTDAKRLRWRGLHDGVVVPPPLRVQLNSEGVPLCEADRTGRDGWAPYAEIIKCEVGGPFMVRWVDGAIMYVPTKLVEVVEAPA